MPAVCLTVLVIRDTLRKVSRGQHALPEVSSGLHSTWMIWPEANRTTLGHPKTVYSDIAVAKLLDGSLYVMRTTACGSKEVQIISTQYPSLQKPGRMCGAEDNSTAVRVRQNNRYDYAATGVIHDKSTPLRNLDHLKGERAWSTIWRQLDPNARKLSARTVRHKSLGPTDAGKVHVCLEADIGIGLSGNDWIQLSRQVVAICTDKHSYVGCSPNFPDRLTSKYNWTGHLLCESSTFN